MVALTELTRLLLPPMVARGRGKVMLLASTAGFQPGPQMAVYCASKAYVLNFGEAIAFELRGSGVTVTTLCPGATETEFAQVAHAERRLFKGGLMRVMNSSDVARIGYQALKAGRGVVITGLLNKIMTTSSRLSPTPVTLRIANWMMSAEGDGRLRRPYALSSAPVGPGAQVGFPDRSSSRLTATAALADSRTFCPSTPATRPSSMK